MIAYKEFKKHFNSDFWKSFKKLPFDIKIPNKEKFVAEVYESIVTKKYYPLPPVRYIDLNKGSGVVRTIPVFDIKDYCIYYFCIKTLESKIALNRTENTFGGWTLGGMMRSSEEDEVVNMVTPANFEGDISDASASPYSFNPYAWSKVYGDFNSKLYTSCVTFQHKYVVEIDIANFYDSVRLDILENKIREIATAEESEVVSLLFHFLNYWNRKNNFYNQQTVGLPQDAMADCSRILANFYLQDYDAYIKAKALAIGGEYFRYADDQFLFAENEEDARKLVFLASKKLNSFGLSINQKKVVFRKTEELIAYRSFAIFDIFADEGTRDNPEIVERFVDEYINIKGTDINNVKDRGVPLLNRVLFRNIKSLPVSKKQIILADLITDEYISKASFNKINRIYELIYARDKRKFINQLLRLSTQLNHNSYHFELIRFLKSKKISVQVVKDRIAELNDYYK
jgi:hypothetical protein